MKGSFILALLFVVPAITFSQKTIRGTVVEKDSFTVMPFVYIVNKSNGNGTMSDNEGRFTIFTNDNDTLVCSYVGYAKSFFPVRSLIPDSSGKVRLVMSKLLLNLQPLIVSTFKIRPYERDYMNKIIDESRIRKLDYMNSPVSALYMQFSKEGKQIRKLAKIFEDIFIEEEVQKKLNPEILRKLTGDENIDYEAFRKYCYDVSNYYILTHEGVDLYSKVMECYKRWKSEGR